MLFVPAKMSAMSREMLKRGVGIVVAGFPATPLNECRARFCLSSSHTREMLDYVIGVIEEMADLIQLRYSRRHLTALKKTPNNSESVADEIENKCHSAPTTNGVCK
jgi:hypothetical protein